MYLQIGCCYAFSLENDCYLNTKPYCIYVCEYQAVICHGVHHGCLLPHGMMTSSNGNIFRVTGHFRGNSPVPGEFPTQRPATRSFDVFFDLHLIKRLSKHSWGWWFETLSPPLWRHRNGTGYMYSVIHFTHYNCRGYWHLDDGVLPKLGVTSWV